MLSVTRCDTITFGPRNEPACSVRGTSTVTDVGRIADSAQPTASSPATQQGTEAVCVFPLDCACTPNPRYRRCIDGKWRRVWYMHGEEQLVKIGPRERKCRGCGQDLTPGEVGG